MANGDRMPTNVSAQLDALEDSLLQAGRTPQQVRRQALAEHIERDASPDTPGEANLARAKSMFPQPSDQQLADFFGRRLDVMHALLGDIYIVHEYEERKQRGEGRDGRRTMPRDANMDKLWEITTPRFSMQPFGLAVRELIGERSLRQFAAKVPMDHRELSRMMRGQSQVTAFYMEKIAKVGGVSPAFFMEYRMQFVTEVMLAVFRARPNLSIGVYKKLKGFIDNPHTHQLAAPERQSARANGR